MISHVKARGISVFGKQISAIKLLLVMVSILAISVFAISAATAHAESEDQANSNGFSWCYIEVMPTQMFGLPSTGVWQRTSKSYEYSTGNEIAKEVVTESAFVDEKINSVNWFLSDEVREEIVDLRFTVTDSAISYSYHYIESEGEYAGKEILQTNRIEPISVANTTDVFSHFELSYNFEPFKSVPAEWDITDQPFPFNSSLIFRAVYIPGHHFNLATFDLGEGHIAQNSGVETSYLFEKGWHVSDDGKVWTKPFIENYPLWAIEREFAGIDSDRDLENQWIFPTCDDLHLKQAINSGDSGYLYLAYLPDYQCSNSSLFLDKDTTWTAGNYHVGLSGHVYDASFLGVECPKAAVNDALVSFYNSENQLIFIDTTETQEDEKGVYDNPYNQLLTLVNINDIAYAKVNAFGYNEATVEINGQPNEDGQYIYDLFIDPLFTAKATVSVPENSCEGFKITATETSEGSSTIIGETVVKQPNLQLSLRNLATLYKADVDGFYYEFDTDLSTYSFCIEPLIDGYYMPSYINFNTMPWFDWIENIPVIFGGQYDIEFVFTAYSMLNIIPETAGNIFEPVEYMLTDHFDLTIWTREEFVSIETDHFPYTITEGTHFNIMPDGTLALFPTDFENIGTALFVHDEMAKDAYMMGLHKAAWNIGGKLYPVGSYYEDIPFDLNSDLVCKPVYMQFGHAWLSENDNLDTFKVTVTDNDQNVLEFNTNHLLFPYEAFANNSYALDENNHFVYTVDFYDYTGMVFENHKLVYNVEALPLPDFATSSWYCNDNVIPVGQSTMVTLFSFDNITPSFVAVDPGGGGGDDPIIIDPESDEGSGAQTSDYTFAILIVAFMALIGSGVLAFRKSH